MSRENDCNSWVPRQVLLARGRASNFYLGLCLLAASVGAERPALAQSPSDARPSVPPVSLLQTQLRHLESVQVGQEYQIRVWLPEGYEKSDKRYPVVYLMDGDFLFGMAADIVQYLRLGGLAPELIIVAPAYGSTHTPENGGANMRNRDFSVFATQANYVPGGGDRFLSFLREELIPYIDSELRSDSTDRTLAGFSRGADFTVFALFTSPDLFRRYVAIDNFYPEYLILEEKLAARRKDLPKKVFLSSRYPKGGDYELAEKMRSRGYTGLEIEYADANPRHVAAPADGLTRGLTSVFNKKSAYALLLPKTVDGKIDAVIAEYQRLKKMPGDSYDLGESALSDLGNALVQMRRPKDAIRVLEVNLESYPQSSNTYRGLGVAYERLGEKEKALENYRRALQINPNDRSAAAAVQRLQTR